MRHAPLFVTPLVELKGHRLLKEIDFSSHIIVPSDLLQLPQPVFQEFPVPNAERYRRP